MVVGTWQDHNHSQSAGLSAFGTDLGCGGTQVPLHLFAQVPVHSPLPSMLRRWVSNSVQSGSGHPQPMPGPCVTFALPVAVGGVPQVPGIFPVELRHQ